MSLVFSDAVFGALTTDLQLFYNELVVLVVGGIETGSVLLLTCPSTLIDPHPFVDFSS